METRKKTLADIDKKVPFKVPNNYFSQFNESIMTMLPEKTIPQVHKVTMWSKTKPWVYMAAMFFGLFFSIKVITTHTSTKNVDNSIATTISQQGYWSGVEISEEDFFDYLETQFIEENYYNLVYNQDYVNSL
ncbi:MAG: hypothetical protein PHI32_01200 [Dysgonamonadaceae bacterium]|nr:hypothetical protein [Dysgonamonadaceae bacterium]MDD4729160.1 hypothetical protein [Dysgonamonadaceae bacterium]